MIIDTEFNSAAQVPARECLEGAELAERLGFGCVWTGESNSRDPLVLLSAMAARTSRIELGTAVYHLFGRSPVTLGIQAATLNDLAEGRLILGLGIANPNIARWHGSDFDRPLRRLREYVDVVRLVYAGSRAEYRGDYYGLDGFRLAFEPPPHPLRVWLAALGPQMTRLAGRISDGIIINLANPAMAREIVDRFRAAAAEAGRDESRLEVVTKLRVSLNPDVSLARAALKKVLTFYSLSYGYQQLLRAMGWGPVVDAVLDAYHTGGFQAARARVPDEMLEDVPMVAASDLGPVRERLRQFEAAGSTRCVVACVVSGDDTWGEIRSFVERADFQPAPA